MVDIGFSPYPDWTMRLLTNFFTTSRYDLIYTANRDSLSIWSMVC